MKSIVIIITLFILSGGIFNDSISAATAGYNFQLPAYEKYTMTNGLTIYLMEQHEVPLIYVQVAIPAGAMLDGDDYGLASMTANGLLFGTKNYSKQQLEESLDFIGASYSAAAGKESAVISMSFMNTDLDKVFPILQELIVYPVFDATEFEKYKKRIIDQLDQAKEHPANVIGAYYAKFLFNDHVYGNPITGTRSSVAKITVEDVITFYHNHYLPGESAIVIVGDFQAKEMKKKVNETFKVWRKQQVTLPIMLAPTPVYTNSRLLLVNKDDATETRFFIGGFGIARSNPDYVAINVINTILGGRFTSWLNDELRINRGLTYGVRSFFTTYKEAGTFAIYSYTRTEKTTEALDVTLEVYNRLHQQGIDETTLTSAKNYIKGQFPPDYETAGDLASLLTEMFIYNFNESFINDFQRNVDELTVAKAKDIIARYFPKENLQFVLIGKAADIRDPVKKYGDLSEKEIKEDGF